LGNAVSIAGVHVILLATPGLSVMLPGLVITFRPATLSLAPELRRIPKKFARLTNAVIENWY
jgi:hypothetical protein